jgi:hypothetical protein
MHRIGLLLLIAACHDAGSATVDAADSRGPGLFVTWQADPAVPGPQTANVTLTDVTFGVDRLEVQSDADGHTTRSRFPLTWSAAGGPAPEAFPDAPSGLYSRVAITLGGFHADAFQLRGTWIDNGKARPFEIRDRGALKTSFEMSQPLAAGGAATIEIAVRLADALAGVDFRRLRELDGVLVMFTGDPQLLGLRARLAMAFRLAD